MSSTCRNGILAHTLMSRINERIPGSPIEELMLGRLLDNTFHRIAETRRRALCEYGLTELVYHALLMIFVADDGVQPSELSAMLRVSRTSGTRIGDELVANGWVARREIEGDRRCQLLMMTEQGNEFLRNILPLQRAKISAIWEPLSVEERHQLSDLLHKIQNALPE